MDESERQFMLGKLAETREIFLLETRHLNEHQARWKPNSDGWSILECVEHVTVAEAGMFHLLTRKTAPVIGLTVPGREREILARGADRTQKYVSPETSAPAGRFATLADAVGTFEGNRSRTIAYVETCQQDLRALEVVHPRGLVTALECLALLTVHPARHALQIRELRRYPQFPKE